MDHILSLSFPRRLYWMTEMVTEHVCEIGYTIM